MKHKIVIGGGCFWCTEAIFKELKGVSEVKSGYSGGNVKDPSYREVCYGRTGHAEVVQVTYDPEQIGLDDILIIHMTTHDPTTLNRQGADSGTQYRSVIYYQNDHEKMIAEEVIREVQRAYDNKIVTEIAPHGEFYEAEAEHQNYYARNTQAGYCKAVINPKLSKFRKLYGEKLGTKNIG